MAEKSLRQNVRELIEKHWPEVQGWILDRHPSTTADELRIDLENCVLYYVGNGRKVGSWPALMVAWADKAAVARQAEQKKEDRLERQHQDRLESKGQAQPKGDKWERYRVRNSGKRHPDDPSLH